MSWQLLLTIAKEVKARKAIQQIQEVVLSQLSKCCHNLSKQTRNKIAKRKFSALCAKPSDGEGEDVETDEKCCICLETLGSEKYTSISSCKHLLHQQCAKDYIKNWLGNRTGMPHCPICREPVSLRKMEDGQKCALISRNMAAICKEDPDFRPCHNKDCPSGFFISKKLWKKNENEGYIDACQYCGKVQCVYCGKEYHEEAWCESAPFIKEIEDYMRRRRT